MAKTHVRIKWKNGDTIDETIVSLPLKTGDEAFRFLEAFEEKCGGPIKDSARDQRWLQVEAQRNSTAAKAA
jgi:hypothetical protein